jgi:hypothetical protein
VLRFRGLVHHDNGLHIPYSTAGLGIHAKTFFAAAHRRARGSLFPQGHTAISYNGFFSTISVTDDDLP